MPTAYPSTPQAQAAVETYVHACKDSEWCAWGDYRTLKRNKATRAQRLVAGSLWKWLKISLQAQPVAVCNPNDLSDALLTVMRDEKTSSGS